MVITLPGFRQSQILEGTGRGNAGQRFAVLDLFQGHLDGLFQLLVDAGEFLDGIVVQQNIRIYAMVDGRYGLCDIRPDNRRRCKSFRKRRRQSDEQYRMARKEETR